MRRTPLSSDLSALLFQTAIILYVKVPDSARLVPIEPPAEQFRVDVSIGFLALVGMYVDDVPLDKRRQEAEHTVTQDVCSLENIVHTKSACTRYKFCYTDELSSFNMSNIGLHALGLQVCTYVTCMEKAQSKSPACHMVALAALPLGCALCRLCTCT